MPHLKSWNSRINPREIGQLQNFVFLLTDKNDLQDQSIKLLYDAFDCKKK